VHPVDGVEYAGVAWRSGSG